MIRIVTIPVLQDNYTYLIVDEPSRHCVILDPPDAQAVVSRLEKEALTPEAIWLTHHHHDHIAGVPELAKLYPGIPILCSARDANRIPDSNRSLSDGDTLEFGGEQVLISELPGHAEGHIGFHFPESGHLFCGDVIFGASCGAVFGDTHSEMYRSVQRVSELPPSTQIWVGHEYTENNLRFAEAVLGEDALSERKAAFQVPSVPLSLETELKTNPFMRLQSSEVLNFLGLTDATLPEEIFKELRLAKDNF